ncbi:ribosomal RNA large subunit methyltransferase H [Striga asiatica]|uniref:Ribosomal RNA large subunit methyltransferase H n=1 Tax=Striga asiatica TaxID=4170 RepID=A0A5A7Q3M5_STRAF|nr:ribosomal RNA large subunit methyltransferase H [Striga asiatica]
MAFTLLASNTTHYTPSPGNECKYAGQSVRALPIRLLTVGKQRSTGVQLIVDEYVNKLKLYCPVEDIRLKSNPRNARCVSETGYVKFILSHENVECRIMHDSIFTTCAFLKDDAWNLMDYRMNSDRTNDGLWCAEAVRRDVMARIEHEDTAVMSLIKQNEWVVMLDERGVGINSEQMASLIGDAGNTAIRNAQTMKNVNNVLSNGASSILFCIGGAYGHGKQLRQRADVSIRLSSLVLNHEVALVVLSEQLYRAWTILKGQKYHH